MLPPPRRTWRTASTDPRPSPDVIRQILRYGASPLHQPATTVDAITDDVQALVDDLIQTMYAAQGIGLAATQIGVSKRIFVVDLSVGKANGDLMIFINPEWVSRDGTQCEEEGCLSVPGFNATVIRPSTAVIQGLDRDGHTHEVTGTGLLARAFQHEMDHLDGTLFVDKLRGLQKSLIARRIRKLTKAGQW
jgi:peptide deformylase